MNKRQKEVQQSMLEDEKKVLDKLEQSYKSALDEINAKITILMNRDDADMQNVIYQVEYQKALQTQVQGILDQLHANKFETISEYLTQSYTNGYVGTMYDLHGQGVPLILPINQEQVVAAIQHETKLSTSLYASLGKDTRRLSKQIASEISRGISSASTYSEIARNIGLQSKIPFNNAMRIARTEAHRIQSKATADAQHRAKEKGADILKQWDAFLDGATRPSHKTLDGQIRELDEPFEVNGEEVMQPGYFGLASEDCNCRCCLLQRARWALDESELENLKDRAEYYGLDKTKDFEEFREKYIKATKDVEKKDKFDYHGIKDFDSMEQYLKQKYNINITDDVKKLDFENVKLSTQGIEIVMKEFPQAQTMLKLLSTSDSGVMCASSEGTISFNPIYYATGKNGLSSMIMGETTGFHPKNTGIIETGSHEMGHILELALIKKHGVIFENIAWNKCTEAKAILKEAYKNAKKTPEGKGLKNFQLASQVSKYALESSSECMAECVADYVANRDNAAILSKELWQILKRELG